MTNKVYVVKYYMDYETHGLHAIFQNKDDAEKYAQMMGRDSVIDCRYSVSEELVYSSLDDAEVAE